MTQKWKRVELKSLPGHMTRRLHQAAVALFMREVADLAITPVQYSSLQTICASPGIDQKTLAATIGFDTSTIGGVIDRLEARGLVLRNLSPTDRRVRLITPTPKGLEMLEAVVPRMLKSQQRLVAPLTKAEREEFMRLIQLVVNANAELSSIPSKD
jgi:DNA-binding MarR family transcriptional regulator